MFFSFFDFNRLDNQEAWSSGLDDKLCALEMLGYSLNSSMRVVPNIFRNTNTLFGFITFNYVLYCFLLVIV